MLVSEVMKRSAKMLGLIEVEKEIDARQSDSGENAAERSADFQKLLNAVSVTAEEVAEEYVPLKAREYAAAEDGMIKFSALERPFKKLYSVKDELGMNVRHVRLDQGILIRQAGAYITYSYETEQIEPDSQIVLGVPLRIFCYGVMAEYYLQGFRYAEANMYHKRFEESALFAARSGIGEMPCNGRLI